MRLSGIICANDFFAFAYSQSPHFQLDLADKHDFIQQDKGQHSFEKLFH